MAKTILVLSDGETYSDLEGASILVITDEAYSALGGGFVQDPRDLSPEQIVMELTLKDVTIRN